MSDIIAFLAGLFSGVLSNVLFLHYLRFHKPRLEISPLVAFDPATERFKIKVFNSGRRQITDIEAKLSVYENRAFPEGHRRVRLRVVPLGSSSVIALGCRRNFGKPWALSPVNIFVTKKAPYVTALLSEATAFERRLVFTICASDAVSGTKLVKRIPYERKDIVVGRFAVGLRFELTNFPAAMESEEVSDEAVPADAPEPKVPESATSLRNDL